MDSKSLEVLEFPRVREILAGFAAFSASRELALGLQPLTDYGQIGRLLQQSAEARRLLSRDPAFSVGGVSDIREPARMASLGKVLEPLSLLEVQQALSAMHDLRRRLSALSADFPLLCEMARGLADLEHVARDIAGCLAPSGEILDVASPALAGIRQQLAGLRRQLLARLEGIIRSPRGEQILQEDIITERDHRYVILVKTERRHDIKGIVHDISNSGETVFLEPAATVGMGNAVRELAIEERREIERILASLSGTVGACYPEIAGSIALAAVIDLALAKARYAARINAAEPALVAHHHDHQQTPDATLKLVNARHPLLTEKAVPLSVEIGRDYSVLVITGPNTGGKTVSLKTIGLLSAMTQAGIPIPASPESRLPVFDGIFADIGDEQSIEQTLSTFSWHMGNIVRIVSRATNRSLVLLDELGTSTDPAEGSALARSILRYFLSAGSITAATTHFGDLKAFAYATPGMQNASLEFDPVTLAPTYHLVVGVPGGSNALATAARLGLPAEIIAGARAMLAEGSQELERLLTSLMAEKQQQERLNRELADEKDRLAHQNAELARQREQLSAGAKKILQEARDTVIQEVAGLHRIIREAIAELRREKSRENLARARQALAAVRERLEGAAWQTGAGEASPGGDDDRIAVGDTVWVNEVSLPATVLAVSETARQVEVQAGRTKMKLGLDSVTKAAQSGPAPDARQPAPRPPAGRRVPPELDLRGKRADEVEWLLDGYLNDAIRANLSEARIIHGIATGTLRQIVRELSATHPLVKSFRPGGPGEGGDGVTVVTL